MVVVFFREALGYLRRHWLQTLISPVMAFTWVTFLHEAAHAAAALVQGGTVTEFSIVPGGGAYGHMAYVFPSGSHHSSGLISLAPYLMWGGMASATSLVALLRWHRGVGRLAPWLFVWAYAVPLLDIGNAALGQLGGRGDLAEALGPPDLLWALGWLFVALFSFATGWLVQRGLYGEEALSVGGYGVTGGIALGILGGVLVIVGAV